MDQDSTVMYQVPGTGQYAPLPQAHMDTSQTQPAAPQQQPLQPAVPASNFDAMNAIATPNRAPQTPSFGGINDARFYATAREESIGSKWDAWHSCQFLQSIPSRKVSEEHSRRFRILFFRRFRVPRLQTAYDRVAILQDMQANQAAQ
jgi:hypothetical protein